MQDTELAELLCERLRSFIRDEQIAADVGVVPGDGARGPFVEVRPTGESESPHMSVHVLGADSVAVSIGQTASADWTGSRESILQTIASLAEAMFRGQLREEVTSSGGQVLRSKLVATTDAGTKTLWTRASARGLLRFGSRKREIRAFPAYPSSS